jgi:hypothetical protein
MIRNLFCTALLMAVLAVPVQRADAIEIEDDPTLREMAAMAQGQRSCERFVLQYSEPGAAGGLTEVEIRSGVVTVKRTSIGFSQGVQSGPVTSEECRALVNSLLENRIWEASAATQHSLGDEFRPRLRLGVTAWGSFHLKLPVRGGERFQQLRDMRNELLALVDRATKRNRAASVEGTRQAEVH